MPTIPAIKATTGVYSSVGILQAIIGMTPELNGVPMPSATTESIRATGQAITQYAPRRNAFCNALINMIGLQRLQYMLFTNPLSWAKQGKLEMGETVEQIWIGLAEAFPYDPAASEQTFAKQMPPDITSAFHSVNYQTTYKITVNYYQLKRAFLSIQGLQAFIEDIIGSVVRAVTYDEFLVTKYLIGTLLLEGAMHTESIAALTAASADAAITTVSTVTNKFQFPSRNYTIAGNLNTTPVDDIYILESAEANALIKVNALASAFNVDYVKFMGHVAMVDSIANLDWDRLDMLFAYDDTSQSSPYDPGYRHWTETEISNLETVQLIAMDRQFLQIYDNYEQMETPFINGEGGYTNYPYQVAKIFGASPFHNAVAFTTVSSGVTSVTVTADNDNVLPGTQLAMHAAVVTTGFAQSGVVWSVPETAGVTIGQDGILRVASSATAKTVTVTATSVYDSTKKGTLAVTIGASAS